MLAALAERIPEIDRVIPFPGFPGIAEQLFDAHTAARFFLQIQAEQFDLVIQLQGSGIYSNPFILMLGAKWSAGMIRPGDPPGRLDAAYPEPSQGHEINRLLEFVEFLGASPRGTDVRLELMPADTLKVEQIIDHKPRPWIAIHSGARDLTRRWSLERFAGVGKALLEKYGGSLILLGEEDESPAAEDLLRIAKVKGSNLAGKLSLPELTASLSLLDILITNDSGPAHLAYAVDTPSVTIFGSADPQRYGPLEMDRHRIAITPVECRPCGLALCPIGYRCLAGVTVENVIAAAEQLLRLKESTP
jgi:ADP-heptose:LPS heptosyltransferase